MRITPENIRPDFTYHIFIDGVEVLNCVMADDESGEIEAYKMRDGEFIIEGDEVKTYKQTGKVVIEKRHKYRDVGAMKCG